jgi:hypothetical protein
MEYNQTPELPPMNARILASCAGLILISASAQAAGSLLSAGPLFTKGNQIVDGAGLPQRLAVPNKVVYSPHIYPDARAKRPPITARSG